VEAAQQIVGGRGSRIDEAGRVHGLAEQSLEEGGGSGSKTLVQGGGTDGGTEMGGQFGEVGQRGGGIVQPAEDGDLCEGRSGQFAGASDEGCGVGEVFGVGSEKSLQGHGEVC
jgi:hypothetical protein